MKGKLQAFINSKYSNIIIFAIMFIIPFIVYRDLYAENFLLAGGDGLGTASNLIFMKNSFSQGEFPLWNKYLSNGVPFAGDISNHAFYIFIIIFSRLPDKLFVYTFYAFHIAMGAFFTYLYLKEIGCNKAVSVCMGFIYLLSVHMGGLRKGHMTIITCIVYLPVILYFVERYFRTNRLKWLIFSSVAMALQFYNAFIQDVMYTDIMVFIYLLVIGIRKRMPFKKMMTHGLIWISTYFGLIALQLIPMFEMLMEYGRAGTSGMSYEIFSSYSIHFIKLLQMLFPFIFGDDIYGSFGPYLSSGLDIELFLGHFILIFLVFGIIRFCKEFRIKFSIFIMAGTFLFAAQTQIPVFSRILYRIPLVGNMRCPARILFIFIFFAFVVSGITMSKLIEKENAKALLRFSGLFTASVLLVLGVAAVAVIIIQGSNGFPEDQMINIYNYFKRAFVKDTLVIVFILILLYLFYKASIKLTEIQYKRAFHIFCAVVMIVTIAETYPFASLSSPVSIDVLKLSDTVSQKVHDDIENYKVWDALDVIDVGHTSIISQNLSMAKGIPSINAYISINNPRIYRLFTQESKADMNFSGLLTGSLKAAINLELQNDLLSMLGVKYIINSSGLINDGSITEIKGIGNELLSEEIITVPNLNGEIFVYAKEVTLKPDTLYKISFDGEFHGSENDMYYVDFYAGELYDSQEQQSSLKLTENQKHYYTYINSGNVPENGNVYVRFVGIPRSEGIIRNFKVNEVIAEKIDNVYTPYYQDEATQIYLNTNARDILYAPEAVKSISSFEDLYTNVFEYDLDDISYVEDFREIDLAGTETVINVTEFKNNSIKAEVSSAADTFINFSQNYYPGWRAYVNGKRVPVYMVNGLIQGIEVPAGVNIIEFKFRPVSIYIGGAISLITLCVGIMIILNERKKLQIAEHS